MRAKKNHGESNTVEYRTWKSMRSRCYNPNHQDSKNYMGRGIKLCERWQSYVNFLADMGRRPADCTSIDRINSNGDYEPENCRWSDAEEQTRNKRSNVFVEVHGTRMILNDAIKALGLNRCTYKNRRHLGWSMEKALFTPVRGSIK